MIRNLTSKDLNGSDTSTERHIPTNYHNTSGRREKVTFAWESFSSLPLDGRGESAAANN